MRQRRGIFKVAGVATLLMALGSGPVDAAPQVPFDPQYPSGASYDVWVDTLDNFGLLTDTNGNGQLNDERCRPDGVAGAQIALATFKAVNAAAEHGCRAIPNGVIVGDGVAETACWVAQGILIQAQVANEIVVAQCEYQDGNITSAELQATFENTNRLIALGNDVCDLIEDIQKTVKSLEAQGLDDALDDCAKIVSLRLPASSGGRSEVVQAHVNTRILEFQATGNYATQHALRIAAAQQRLAVGAGLAAAGQYEAAYRDYCAAYRLIANTDDR
jgi:hypothetical protein